MPPHLSLNELYAVRPQGDPPRAAERRGHCLVHVPVRGSAGAGLGCHSQRGGTHPRARADLHQVSGLGGNYSYLTPPCLRLA